MICGAFLMNWLDHLLSKRDLACLLELSQKSLQCWTEGQIKDLVLGLKQLIGFENACCSQANMPDNFLERNPDVSFLDICYPDGFTDVYWEKRYHLNDPVLCSAMILLSPVTFREVELHTGPSKTIALARDFGMKNGWAHCTVDPQSLRCTVFFLNGPQPDTSLRAKRIIEHIIPFYSLAYTRAIQRTSQPSHPLTPKEIEVVKWLKEGKSSWEISVILKCSKRVVDFHVSNIKAKLDAVSRAQCVAKAVEGGIIAI